MFQTRHSMVWSTDNLLVISGTVIGQLDTGLCLLGTTSPKEHGAEI